MLYCEKEHADKSMKAETRNIFIKAVISLLYEQRGRKVTKFLFYALYYLVDEYIFFYLAIKI
jgi:hypothetical protein